jgi:hypothetical protein
MDAFEILVVILSITLAILLILTIILIVAITKLVNKLREISEKAEEVVNDVEAVSSFFRKSAGPVAITGLISNIVSKVAEFSNKKGKKGE